MRRAVTIAAVVAIPTIGIPTAATAAPPGAVTAGASDAVLDIIAQCESGNRNVNNSTFPKSSASGHWQIINGTWARFGGREFAPRAIGASRAEQLIVARRIATANPSLSDWNPSRKCWGPKVARHATGRPAPRTAAAPTAPRHAVTVARGDTLSEIAARISPQISVADLYARNRAVVGANPNLIFPGQVLTF